MTQSPKSAPPTRWRLMLSIIVISVVALITTIWFYYGQQSDRVRDAAVIQLSSVAQLRVSELSQWRKERIGDCLFYQNNPDFARLLRESLAQPLDTQPVERLASWIQASRENHGYHIVLLDPSGRIRYADDPAILPSRETLKACLNDRQARMLEFYRPPGSATPFMAFVIPFTDNHNSSEAIGTMLWILDPRDYIYPLVARWPFHSESAETLLLQRDKSEVVCLTPLKESPDRAFDLRVPTSDNGDLLVRAATGPDGMLTGLGRRRQKVIAVAQTIPDTPWTLLVSLDREEVEAPLAQRLRELLLTTMSLLTAAAAAIAYLLHGQRSAFLRERLTNAEALRESDKRFRLLFNSTPDAIFLVENQGPDHPPGRFVEVNDGACRLLGYTREELLTKGPLDVDSAEAQKGIPHNVSRLSATGLHSWEGEMISKDGRAIPLEINTRAIKLDGRSLWLAQARDIGKRKQDEAQLARLTRTLAVGNGINQAILRERDLHALFAQACSIALEKGGFALTWIGLIDEAGLKVVPVAHAGECGDYLNELRLELDDPVRSGGICGRAIRNQSHAVSNRIADDPGMSPWAAQAANLSLRSCAAFPLIVQGRPRGVISFYFAANDIFADDEVALLTDVARNLSLAMELSENESRRLHAEQALRASEQRFRSILENMPGIAVQGYDREKRVIFWNQASAALYGWTAEEAMGRQPHELFIPADQYPEIYATIDAWLVGGPPLLPGEFTLRRKDGGEISVFSGFFLLNNATGQPEIYSIDIDLTARNAAQAELHLLHAALEATPSAWIITDAEGIIQWVNPAFSAMTGYPQEEVLGRTPHLLYSGHQPDTFYENLWDTIKSGRIWSGELQNRRRDGSLYHEQMMVAPVRNRHGTITHFVAMKQDISDHKRLEHQLLRAQRMEGIGLLAGGIAHDLNNVLAPILLSVELLRLRFPGPEHKSTLDVIESSARRGAGVVRQVLTFARGIDGERVPLRPKDLLREIAFIAEETFPRAITVRRDVDDNLPAVQGDATQLHQVLLNLSVNARDAMPDGGTLDLAACETTVTSGDSSRYMGEVKPGRYIRLTVSDTGIGIPSDNLERIFEPFFTTKGIGQGTGLGLSAVFGIVRSHGGFIEVDSTVGKGSSFHVYLPSLARENAVAAQPKVEGVVKGNGRGVLVCDDEEAIRLISGSVLGHAGFVVFTAADGTEARRLYSQHSDKIHLALLDIMMPGETGDQIALALRKDNPLFPVLFSTGMVGNASVEEILKRQLRQPNTAMLTKPYDEQTLLASVIHLLEHPVRPAKHS